MRASRRAADQHRRRRWDLNVMAKALYKKATNDDISIRAAAMLSASSPDSKVSHVTLFRYWLAMPYHLKDINQTDEAKILQWINEYESSLIKKHRDHHHTALTRTEEEILVAWIKDAQLAYQPVGVELIKAKAKAIILEARGVIWEGYHSFVPHSVGSILGLNESYCIVVLLYRRDEAMVGRISLPSS